MTTAITPTWRMTSAARSKSVGVEAGAPAGMRSVWSTRECTRAHTRRQDGSRARGDAAQVMQVSQTYARDDLPREHMPMTHAKLIGRMILALGTVATLQGCAALSNV